ncbi:hypothetical protein ACGF5O_27830 [Streptomyces sp. NPDC048291]|uniref:hypothetical protein n=1 Tax=Streptomyces sp. NPDC048291 TaxID=3365530 RepID=UPI003720E987
MTVTAEEVRWVRPTVAAAVRAQPSEPVRSADKGLTSSTIRSATHESFRSGCAVGLTVGGLVASVDHR